MLSVVLFILVFLLAAVFLGVFRRSNYRDVSGKFKGGSVFRVIAAFIIAYFAGSDQSCKH